MIDFGYGVQLGPLRNEHVWEYFNARNDYSVWRWCRQFDVLREDEHEAWLLSVQTSKKNRMYEILDGERLCGVAGLTDIDPINQRAEFSLYVFPDCQQRGYGKSGLRTLIHHGFNNLNLNRIWGETYEGNPAYKMFEDLGFEKEGIRKEFYFREGRFIDAVLYSLGRAKWLKPS